MLLRTVVYHCSVSVESSTTTPSSHVASGFPGARPQRVTTTGFRGQTQQRIVDWSPTFWALSHSGRVAMALTDSTQTDSYSRMVLIKSQMPTWRIIRKGKWKCGKVACKVIHFNYYRLCLIRNSLLVRTRLAHKSIVGRSIMLGLRTFPADTTQNAGSRPDESETVTN